MYELVPAVYYFPFLVHYVAAIKKRGEWLWYSGMYKEPGEEA